MTPPAPAWQELGLPGLVDVHVHVLPPNVERKVWAYFEKADKHYGREWPVTYAWPLAERRAELAALGVRAYPGLVYPHKAGMAEWLTDFALDYAGQTDEVVASATFFPEPGAPDYVRAAIARGARIFKAHLEVGRYDPRDPLLDEVWGTLADAGIPVVAHCGDGPVPGPFTGVEPIGEVLARHPSLRVVVAHTGMPRYADFLDLAARYPSVMLDTTMAFTDFAESTAPFPRPRLAELRDLGLAGRILLGSDFPSIPYRYEHQIEALVRLDLGDDWLRQVLYFAPAAVLGVGATVRGPSPRGGAMAVEFNHTLVHVRDVWASARSVADILGLEEPSSYGPFAVVTLANGASLDFFQADEVRQQHYAFLVSEAEFDEILGRIKGRGYTFWADPFRREPGSWNTDDGGRGLYWEGPDGHVLEIITRPYGSGG